jgi:hypothetical protein
MRKATLIDMPLVTDLVVKMFDQNPGVDWLMKPGASKTTGIRKLAEFAFLKCFNRKGVFVSSNEKGAAFCYRFNSGKFSFAELGCELRFALPYIGISRLPKILKREAYRKKLRPASGDYFYFWFFAVSPDGKEAAFELKNAIFKEAKLANLPIYLETAVERNQKVYERFGFKTYHIWDEPGENIKFWFMKWEPESSVSV